MRKSVILIILLNAVLALPCLQAHSQTTYQQQQEQERQRLEQQREAEQRVEQERQAEQRREEQQREQQERQAEQRREEQQREQQERQAEQQREQQREQQERQTEQQREQQQRGQQERQAEQQRREQRERSSEQQRQQPYTAPNNNNPSPVYPTRQSNTTPANSNSTPRSYSTLSAPATVYTPHSSSVSSPANASGNDSTAAHRSSESGPTVYTPHAGSNAAATSSGPAGVTRANGATVYTPHSTTSVGATSITTNKPLTSGPTVYTPHAASSAPSMANSPGSTQVTGPTVYTPHTKTGVAVVQTPVVAPQLAAAQAQMKAAQTGCAQADAYQSYVNGVANSQNTTDQGIAQTLQTLADNTSDPNLHSALLNSIGQPNPINDALQQQLQGMASTYQNLCQTRMATAQAAVAQAQAQQATAARGQTANAQTGDAVLPTGHTFAPLTVRFGNISGYQGSAHVVSTPPGIDCPATCSFQFGQNAAVMLFATADQNSAVKRLSCQMSSGTGMLQAGNDMSCSIPQWAYEGPQVVVYVDPYPGPGANSSVSNGRGANGGSSAGNGSPSGSGGSGSSGGTTAVYLAPITQGCIREFWDTKHYNWLSFENDCGQAVNLTWIAKNPNDHFGASNADIAAGQSTNTGWSQTEVATKGDFALFICPAGSVAVDGNTRQMVNNPNATYSCKKQ